MDSGRLHLPSEQNYDCVQCGRSCQAGWDIAVEEPVRRQLEGHPLTLRVIQERGAAMVEKKGEMVLKMAPACGYLEPDLLCGVHRHIGVQAKPSICRLFPYILSHTPEGTYVGVSYACTAARQNLGRPLSVQSAEVQQLLELGATVNIVQDDGLLVHGSWFIRYSDYRRLEQEILQRAEAVGIFAAISEALCGLGRQVSGWARPRNTNPRPAPEELAGCGAIDNPLLTRLRGEMWSQLSQHLLPELEGVEPVTRAHFQKVTESLRDVRGVEPLHSAEVEKYLRHLVFRKQLVMHPTLLSNLCLLDFLPTFLSLYGHGFARHRGRTMDDQDYWDALDLAEKFLVYHCRGLRPVYQRCARFLIEQFRRPNDPAAL
ncbi:MAG: hypothetical protein U0931_23305 [Vulcanimicrobiota bacterium]